MNTDKLPYSRNEHMQHYLRKLIPILEEKGIIGTVIKATELAKICRNHRRRLGNQTYRALDLADGISGICGGLFVFENVQIQVYQETDPDTRRRCPSLEFQRFTSLEQQHVDSVKHNKKGQSEAVNSALEKSNGTPLTP